MLCDRKTQQTLVSTQLRRQIVDSEVTKIGCRNNTCALRQKHTIARARFHDSLQLSIDTNSTSGTREQARCNLSERKAKGRHDVAPQAASIVERLCDASLWRTMCAQVLAWSAQ